MMHVLQLILHFVSSICLRGSMHVSVYSTNKQMRTNQGYFYMYLYRSSVMFTHMQSLHLYALLPYIIINGTIMCMLLINPYYLSPRKKKIHITFQAIYISSNIKTHQFLGLIMERMNIDRARLLLYRTKGQMHEKMDNVTIEICSMHI